MKASYKVIGNVVWLAGPPKDQDRRRTDPAASLKESITRLIAEVERSGRLKADIAAALDARRYALYQRSTTLGVRASNRSLAAAERSHVGSMLKFIYTIAAAGSTHRAGKIEPAARLDPLTRSIRDLEAGVMRARQLSQDVLAQCQWRDCRGAD
jgi:hypothetical protein